MSDETSKVEGSTSFKQRFRRLLRIFALAKHDWRWLVAGTLFALLESLVGLSYPLAAKQLIDELTGGSSVLTGITYTIAIMIGISVSRSLFGWCTSILFSFAGERIISRLKKRLFDRLLAQEVGFYDKTKTGEIMSRLSSDTSHLEFVSTHAISRLLRNIITLTGSFIFLFAISTKLTLVMLTIVPPISIASVLVFKKVYAYSKEARKIIAQANEVAEEAFSAVRTVKSFVQEPTESNRYATQIETSKKLEDKRALLWSTYWTGNSLFHSIGTAFVLWVGGHMVVDGTITPGLLGSFVLYTNYLSSAIDTLTDLWGHFARALGSSERVFELLDRDPQLPKSGTKKLPNVQGKLEFKNVEFAYPTRTDIKVLKNIDLQIKPGEKIALVGPSGSGKSTFCALLQRYYDPIEGLILLDEVDLKEFDISWLRQQMAIVSQEPVLMANSIAYNIRYGNPAASLEEIQEAAKIAQAHDFIKDFPEGYDTIVGERGVQLSGGQKQRVAIARAVLRNPKVLILDEATSALDAESEFHVKKALDYLMVDKTTLIIAHRLSTVRDADRVAVLKAGQLAQLGTHQQLMSQPGVYSQLVLHQLEHQEKEHQEKEQENYNHNKYAVAHQSVT